MHFDEYVNMCNTKKESARFTFCTRFKMASLKLLQEQRFFFLLHFTKANRSLKMHSDPTNDIFQSGRKVGGASDQNTKIHEGEHSAEVIY